MFKTMIDQPLMAMFIVQMAEAKQITAEVARKALADPELATFLVRHELEHWTVKRCLSRSEVMDKAMDIVIAATLEQSQ